MDAINVLLHALYMDRLLGLRQTTTINGERSD